MGLNQYEDQIRGALGDNEAARRWHKNHGNGPLPPYVAIGILIALALGAGIFFLAVRCSDAAEENKVVETAEDEAAAVKLVDEMRTKLAGARTLAPIPDAACPAEIKRVAVAQQAWLVHSILDREVGEPPVFPPIQSTPLVWIAQHETLPVAQRKNRNRRLREILDDKYLAVAIATKASAVQPSEPGHYEGQIQIIEMASGKPACAMTLVFDVYKPTNQSDHQVWATAFWAAADAALAKAAPGAKFQLD